MCLVKLFVSLGLSFLISGHKLLLILGLILLPIRNTVWMVGGVLQCVWVMMRRSKSQCVGFQLFRSTALIWFLDLVLSLRPLWSNRSKQQAQQKICSMRWEGFLSQFLTKEPVCESSNTSAAHTLFRSSKQHCSLAVTVTLSGKSLHKQQQKSVIRNNKQQMVWGNYMGMANTTSLLVETSEEGGWWSLDCYQEEIWFWSSAKTDLPYSKPGNRNVVCYR